MAINRIGKGGGLPPTPDASGTGGVQQKGAVERPFHVERPDATKQAQAAQQAGALEPTSPLARLRAGEIDVHGYIDLKVDEATHGLHGLEPAQLDAIKKTLRDQMASDPGLTDLVRTATGQMPTPPEDFEDEGLVEIGRRAFLAALALTGCSDCKDRGTMPNVAVPDKPLPVMPEAGAPPSPRGKVGTTLWTFDGGGRAIAIVPSWLEPDAKLPVLVALHGRGEAAKGPEEGVMGWPRDYALLRAIERVCAPPITDADLEGFSDPTRLAELNATLAKRPFQGLVVVCPYTNDVELRKTPQLREYGRYLLESVIPRARKELPILDAPRSIGIDGVSLGGAIALRVGLENAQAFGAVGTLQAAIGEDQIPELTEIARAARVKNPDVKLRLLTSHDDYFKNAITKLSASWRAAGIEHDFADVPGPHDYPFNRGPGAIEMLVWHDRMLAR